LAGFVGTGTRPVATAAAKNVRVNTMGDRGEAAPRITSKLDVANYLSWSHEVEYALRYRALWGLVVPEDSEEAEATLEVTPHKMRLRSASAEMSAAASGSGDVKAEDARAAARAQEELASDQTVGAAVAAQRARAEKARVVIMMSVKPHHGTKLRRYTTARDLWAALAAEFKPKGSARAITLHRQLNMIAMEDKESPVLYFNRGWELVGQLGEISIDIDDQHLLSALLAGLSPRFELTSAVMQNNRNLTLREALEDLQAADDRFALERAKNKPGKGAKAADTDGVVLVAAAPARKGRTHSRAKMSPEERTECFKNHTCYNCQEKGHLKRDCRNKYKPRPTKEALVDEVGNAGLAMLAHVPAADAGVSQAHGDWIVDSGASHHMCGDASTLTNVHDAHPVSVTIADGTVRRAVTRGTAVLRVVGPTGYTSLRLDDVLILPGIAMSLFSVRTAARRGFRTVLKENEVVVVDASGTVRVTGYPSGGIYALKTTADGTGDAAAAIGTVTDPVVGTSTGAASAPASASVWHQRFSHAGIDSLLRTLGAVDGMDFSRSSLEAIRGNPCEPCIAGKMVRAPYVPSTNAPTRVLAICHSDAAGPMAVPTPEGYRYLISVIDGYSRFKTVVPVKEKGQAKTALMRVLDAWENKTGSKVGVIRTDDGKEYGGEEFDSWVAAKGIERQRSAPYMHQHNGVAERYNRTVQERMTALLTDAGLDFKYWAEAAITATVTDNRIPPFGGKKTPFELFHGTVPDVSDLRAFGCKGWAYLPPELRRSLDPRAILCTFLGYAAGTMGFRVLVGNTVLIRRDVRFDESQRGLGGAWGSTARRGPARVAGAYPSPGPVADAVAAARRLTGLTAAPDLPSVDGTAAREETTDAASSSADESSLASDDVADDDGDGPAPSAATRRSSRLRARYQSGGVAITAWALAATGRAPQDKMRMDQARLEPDWDLFDTAIQAEVDALWANHTWELVALPPGKRLTQTVMLCERKRGADGQVTKHKGRYVVRGDTQTYMQDYFEVWAPVARYTTLRVFLAYCASRGLAMQQMDVATAFLNWDVAEEIYIPQPRGYERGDPGKVCNLNKALYGLKQAARAWHRKLKETLGQAGYTACAEDPCLFVGGNGNDVCLILVYVDDLLVAGKTMASAKGALRVVSDAFKARELGAPSYFLGLHIERDEAVNTLLLHQRQYVATLLQRFGMADAHPVRLPMGTGVKLQKAGVFLTPELTKTYQELVGALLYLCTGTRPDIAYAVGHLTRYVASPTVDHLAAAKVVLRYLKGTDSLGVCYQADGDLHGYCDADFGADVDTRRSTTGPVFMYKGGAVAWGSKVQLTVAASTTEAEYIASAVAAKEAVWLRRLCGFLEGHEKPVVIRCDNQSALAMINNPVSSTRTKHIDISHHFIRERVADGTLAVRYVATGEQVADALTKPLGTIGFLKCVAGMGMDDKASKKEAPVEEC